MLFHGEEINIDNGTATSTKIWATGDDMPTPRGEYIPHVRDFYLYLNLALLDTATMLYLIEDYLLNVFSHINMKLKDGSMLYDTTNSRMIRLLHLLHFRTLDDYDVTTTKTNLYEIKFPLKFNWYFDNADYTYLYPADEFEEIDIPITTTVTGFTTSIFSYNLVADVVWLPQRVRSPVRRWRNYVEAGQKISLPAGKYHFAAILNDKDSDANLYDLGLTCDGPNFQLKKVPGALMAHQFNEDIMDRNDAGRMYNILNSQDIDATLCYNNLIQPLIWEKDRALLPQDGILGRLNILREAADPTMADLFVLESFG